MRTFHLYASLFFYLLTGPLLAQSEYTVVSTTGLKMRAAPDGNSKVLAIAPFGTQVTVLINLQDEGHRLPSPPQARRDTIGILRKAMRWNGHAMEAVQEPHVGYWWPVRYKGKTGYMFSGFLASKEELGADYYPHQNEQWRLQSPGGNACNSSHVDLKKEWQWYGLFRQSNGKFALRAVQLRYAVADYRDEQGNYEMLQRELIILVKDEPEEPLFLIGRREALPERADITGDEAYRVAGEMSGFLNPDGSPNTGILKNYGVMVKSTTDVYTPGYYMYMQDAAGKKQQPVLYFPGRDYTCTPSELLWVGDLDGDGKRDYLFDVAGKMGANMLYLSSQAKPGEIAGLVAVLWHWYCC